MSGCGCRPSRAPGIIASVAFILCALMLGCSSSPRKPTPAKSSQHIKDAVAALIKAGDADSLAAAALLELQTQPDHAWPLMERSVSKGQLRPDLIWLEIQVCQATLHCDPVPMENLLRSMDSANGYGWMGALARAEVLKDDAASLGALTAIGRSERFDIYWTTLNARLSAVATRTKKLSFIEAQQLVTGGLVSRVLPSYGVLTAACKGERIADPAQLSACRGVAHSLQNGDTYLTEMIGVQIAQNVWPETSPAWAAAEQERKAYEYTSSHWVKITNGLADTAVAERYLQLCARYHREQEVWRAQLIDAGESPTPPAQ